MSFDRVFDVLIFELAAVTFSLFPSHVNVTPVVSMLVAPFIVDILGEAPFVRGYLACMDSDVEVDNIGRCPTFLKPRRSMNFLHMADYVDFANRKGTSESSLHHLRNLRRQ